MWNKRLQDNNEQAFSLLDHIHSMSRLALIWCPPVFATLLTLLDFHYISIMFHLVTTRAIKLPKNNHFLQSDKLVRCYFSSPVCHCLLFNFHNNERAMKPQTHFGIFQPVTPTHHLRGPAVSPHIWQVRHAFVTDRMRDRGGGILPLSQSVFPSHTFARETA